MGRGLSDPPTSPGNHSHVTPTALATPPTVWGPGNAASPAQDPWQIQHGGPQWQRVSSRRKRPQLRPRGREQPGRDHRQRPPAPRTGSTTNPTGASARPPTGTELRGRASLGRLRPVQAADRRAELRQPQDPTRAENKGLRKRPDAGNQASTSATATPTGPPTASGDSTLTDVLHRLRRQCPSIEISYASGTKCNVLYQVSQTQNEQTHDRFAHN